MKVEIKRSIKDGEEIVEVDMNPKDILHDPILNKGTGFTDEERKELQLHGLLPYHVSTIEEQIKRRYVNFLEKTTPLAKFKFLSALQDRNETLFFRLLSEHPEEMLPFIYTPTVGDASLNYSYVYNQNRGVYLSYPLKDQIDEIIQNLPKDRVDVTVITDGGRILGLGDLGMGGMAIPVGKLSLYTLFGGINPAYTLPIQLDIGTNNQNLLNDPLYLGWRHERVTGKEYDDFIDTVVKALTKRFPKILIQWEDFSKDYAQPILDRYHDRCCCFNDDIQGTAGVVMAGIFAALKGIGTELKDQRIVFYGAGSAGIGIAHLIAQAMGQVGISYEEAKKKIYVLGRTGLAHTASNSLDDLKKRFAQKHENISSWKVEDIQNISLLEVVKHVQPTILIGTSTQPGSFTEDVIVEMKKHVARPIIFPLSNPTSKSEAVPEDLMKWTRGQAIIATGSPFPPVEFEGKKYVIGQCNNVNIFPGVGLGVLASGAKRVTDKMFLSAAEVLSGFAPIINNPYASLFPRINQLRPICKSVAMAVGKVAIEEGVASIPLADLEKAVEDGIWEPKYAVFKKLKK